MTIYLMFANQKPSFLYLLKYNGKKKYNDVAKKLKIIYIIEIIIPILFNKSVLNINEQVIIVVTLLTKENTNNIIPKIKSVVLNPFFVLPYLLSINIIIK